MKVVFKLLPGPSSFIASIYLLPCLFKWENLCIPKDYGVLGIMNTRIMND